MKSVVVVDASLAAMWAMPERFSTRALALAGQWAKEETRLIAPYLLLTEVTNAFYKRILRGEMSLSSATAALEVVFEFAIEIREEPGLHSRAIELSYQLKRPNTYDCHYLALAENYRCDLWTGDERFFNSVTKTFSRVKWVGNFLHTH
jgi:predicted nucleic acid-binding protein